MKIEQFNALPREAVLQELERCCGSHRWCEQMEARRPFKNFVALQDAASEAWRALSAEDWLEAFRHHPRIGDVSALKAKFASTATWASQEQAGAATATDEVLRALHQGNQDYEARFGHIFLICATGKSAAEMLEALKRRLPNDPARELTVAADEQDKITRIRLAKLVEA
ncbi:MAG: 2-oxo-4-hydroxy-4-carboxy-5-ureidoimidazoline decarboxylase [Planctomycetia bacterium]|nr:2-oxo-4-hydroxy-4-carboxy-5-ureidoimidazoline decarboxylase [Planctomycetia bacterium]